LEWYLCHPDEAGSDTFHDPDYEAAEQAAIEEWEQEQRKVNPAHAAPKDDDWRDSYE